MIPPSPNYKDKTTDSIGASAEEKTNTQNPEEEPNEFWLCANQDTSIKNCLQDKDLADQNLEGYALTVGIVPDILSSCPKLEYKALIGFDITDLPIDRKIQEVGLTLSMPGMQLGWWGYVDVYIIISPWDSSSVTWNSSPQIDSKTITIKLDDSGYYDIIKLIKTAFAKYGNSWHGILLAENKKESIGCEDSLVCDYCCTRDIQPIEGGKSTCPELFIKYKKE